MKIARAIREMVAEWELDPEEINEGSCSEFAQAVEGRVKGAEVAYLEDYVEDERDLNVLPYHVWVKFNGRHYDAETPDGVDEWQDLPTIRPFYAPRGG